MNRDELLTIRDVRQEDVPFILSTWLKGLYYGGDKMLRKIPKDVFMANQHKNIERILQTPGVQVKVACLKEDADVIVGYSVYRTGGDITVFDWAFCKRDWRGIGIAKSLAPPHFDIVTNLTRPAEAILQKSFPKVTFNPWL
jgi:hypothetical protein